MNLIAEQSSLKIIRHWPIGFPVPSQFAGQIQAGHDVYRGWQYKSQAASYRWSPYIELPQSKTALILSPWTRTL